LSGASSKWDRAFDDPIPLPSGGELRTLRDAGNFIAKLPKREYDALKWQAAIRALMLVVEHDGRTLLARIGMMHALYPRDDPKPTPRRRRAKKHRIVRSRQTGAGRRPETGRPFVCAWWQRAPGPARIPARRAGLRSPSRAIAIPRPLDPPGPDAGSLRF
jgi:hypothetical protein